MSTQLKNHWEARLAKHGLSNRQITAQEVIALPTPVSESLGIQKHQFDKALEGLSWKSELLSRIEDKDLVRFHEVSFNLYTRIIPAWAVSDDILRQLLLSLFPRLEHDRKHRQRAADVCALVYRYFRLNETACSIAKDLRVPMVVIERRIQRIKARAIALGF